MERCDAALLISSDVRHDQLAAFRAWHNLEHLPERMAIPGFRSVRRFVSLASDTSFLTLYQTASIEVFDSDAYRARLTDPTPKTVRILRDAVTNATRVICRWPDSVARGEGGLLAIWPVDGVMAAAELDAAHLEASIAAMHRLIVDHERTAVGSTAIADLDRRPSAPDALLLAEGWSSQRAFADALPGIAARYGIDRTGRPRLYRLEAASRG